MRTATTMQQCDQALAGPSARPDAALAPGRPAAQQQRQQRGRQPLAARAQPGRLSARQSVVARASADTETAKSEAKAADEGGETYEVYISKPLGIRFGRGKDGMAYIAGINPTQGNVNEEMQVGDKLVELSASFGDDVWPAGNYGQTMYAIKTRNGQLYFKIRKMYGDLSAFEEDELSETEKRFKKERAGGNYGGGTKELQLANFKAKKEREARRKELFNAGLAKFNAKDVQNALYDFEEVIAMELKQPNSAREFAMVSSLYRVAHYNIACCYAALDQVEAGLEALELSMSAGFDQFSKIRADANLAKLRESPKFQPLIERFDEPVIDTSIFKGLSGLFGGKK